MKVRSVRLTDDQIILLVCALEVLKRETQSLRTSEAIDSIKRQLERGEVVEG